jgi:hypothetical protein
MTLGEADADGQASRRVQHVPPLPHFVRQPPSAARARPYRRRMTSFSESAFQDRDEGPSFLSRVVLSVVLLTAGIGVALLIAAV